MGLNCINTQVGHSGLLNSSSLCENSKHSAYFLQVYLNKIDWLKRSLLLACYLQDELFVVANLLISRFWPWCIFDAFNMLNFIMTPIYDVITVVTVLS